MFAILERKCSRCNETAIRPYYLCRSCRNTSARKWREKNREKSRKSVREWHAKNSHKLQRLRRLSRLKTAYGLSGEAYEALLTGQAFGCAICGSQQGCSKGRKLFVDHNHETKKIRGLLCSKCNFLIGIAGDKPEILSKAISYIERNQ